MIKCCRRKKELSECGVPFRRPIVERKQSKSEKKLKPATSEKHATRTEWKKVWPMHFVCALLAPAKSCRRGERLQLPEQLMG